MYNWFKVLHVVGAAVLFGTGMATAMMKLLSYRTKNINIIASVSEKIVYADWMFTGTAGVLQPITGMIMVMIKGYSILTFWVVGSIAGYLLTALCWLPVVQIQIKLRGFAVSAQEQNTPLPPEYYRYFKWWFILGWPAFISLVCVFFLMANRPESYTQLLQQLKII